MAWTETILSYSVEGFLTLDEADTICVEMDAYKRQLSEDKRVAGEGNSIHTVKDMTVSEAVALYEPNGRVEIRPLPPAVDKILDAAVERRMADLRRAYPSVSTVGPWFYVEYGPGQHITPHADQYKNKAYPEHPKVAGISLQLNDDFTGGEFFVETCGSPRLWTADDEGNEVLIRRANESSEVFRSLPRTRWLARSATGTAYLYGSQLVHGTEPVRDGRVRKVISWLNG